MKTLLALTFAAFSGIAFAGGGGDKIEKYDTDGDGRLSHQEVSTDAKLSAQFVELDANGDGHLDTNELDNHATDDFEETAAEPIER